MKRIYSILTVLALPAFLLLYSYTGGSPGGKTGSPGDGGATCTQCHTGTAQAQGGLITTNIPFTGYEAGQTYTITVSANMSGISKYGYELTAEDASGIKQGTFVITDPSRTKTANGGKAVTHTSGGTIANSNAISWSADWTAPAVGSGSISFYTALNATNSNGSTSGDQIYTSSRTVSEHVANPQIVGVDPNIVAQDYVGNTLITGNETTWDEGVTLVSFVLHDNASISFDAASFTVNSNTEIDAVLPSLTDQTVGLYDVHVDDLVLENGFTLTVIDAIANIDFSNNINIYPNPATDKLTVNGIEGADIQIIDISGRVYFTKQNINAIERVNVSNLNPGLYVVIITKEGKNAIKKFIVK